MNRTRPTPLAEIQESLLRPDEWDDASWEKSIVETLEWLSNLAEKQGGEIKESPKALGMLKEVYELTEKDIEEACRGLKAGDIEEKQLAAYIASGLVISMLENGGLVAEIERDLPRWNETVRLIKNGGSPADSDVAKEITQIVIYSMRLRMSLSKTEGLTRAATALLAEGGQAALKALVTEARAWQGTDNNPEGISPDGP